MRQQSQGQEWESPLMRRALRHTAVAALFRSPADGFGGTRVSFAAAAHAVPGRIVPQRPFSQVDEAIPQAEITAPIAPFSTSHGEDNFSSAENKISSKENKISSAENLNPNLQPTIARSQPDPDWFRLQAIYQAHQQKEQPVEPLPAAPPDITRFTGKKDPAAQSKPPQAVVPEPDTSSDDAIDSGSMTTGGATTAGGAMTVGGSLTTGGNVTIGGSATVGGNAAVGGSTTVGGDTAIGGGLATGGAMDSGGNTQIGATATIGGAASAGQNVTVGGAMQVGGGTAVGQNTTVGGSAQFSDAVVVGENLDAGANVQSGGGVTVGGQATAGSALAAAENVQIGQSATIGAALVSTGDVTIGQTAQVGGLVKADSLTVGQSLTTAALKSDGDLEVGGSATTGPAKIGGGLNVSGSVSIAGSAKIGGDISAGGNVTIAGSSNVAAPGGSSSAAPVQRQPAAQPSLEAVWPVQRLSQPTYPPMDPSTQPTNQPTLPPDAPERTRVRDSLSKVAASQPTDSTVELVLPRRPRPATAVIQRQPMPQPTTVPTEIGELPGDLWELIGKRPPENSEQSTANSERITEYGTRNTSIQREPAEDQEVETAVSPTDEPANPAEQAESANINLDDLARRVYADLRTRLTVEWERARGR